MNKTVQNPKITNRFIYDGFEVLVMVIIIFWDMMLCVLLGFCFLLGLLFEPEDGGSSLLRNVEKLRPDYTTSHSRRQYSSGSFMNLINP
jgi:hypothetical protein